MKAEELRLNNLIYNGLGQPFKVNATTISEFSLGQSVLGDFKPIPLTEEWLRQFGFLKDDDGNYWIDLQTHYLELVPSRGYLYPTYVQVPEMSYEDEQRVIINRIEFVHELQNLYFALRGEELELNQ